MTNQSIIDPPPSILESTIILILSIALSIVTIGGNILVLCSFYLEPALRVSSNYFIASLAVTDLLIGLFSMNLYTLYIVLGFWPLNDLLCDLWLSMDYTACLTSQYTVFLITVDRFCSIKMPMKYQKWRSDKIIIFMIFLTWIVPSVMFYSIIMSWQYVFGRQRKPKQCYAEFSEKPVFITILTVCYFWITLVVMIGLYIGIYRVALDLQNRSNARKARLNNFFLIPLANRQTNGSSDLGKIDNRQYECKEEEIYSSSYNIVDYESASLRQSHSSCFVLYANQLPNIESPVISDDSFRYSTIGEYPSRYYNGPVSKSSSFQSTVKPNGHQTHHHCFCNIHRDHSTLFRAHCYSCCEIPGLQFLDLDNLESCFNLNSPRSNGQPEFFATKSSPIWKERSVADKKGVKSTNFVNVEPRQKATSFTLRSPLQKVAKKFYGVIQKTNSVHSNITQNRNRAVKALRTISLILGAFMLCWTPFHVVILIKAACDNGAHSCINKYIYRLAYWLCYINSPLNPFCYALANTQIKETFFKIFSCKYNQR